MLRNAGLPPAHVVVASRQLQFMRVLILSECPLIRGALALETYGKGCMDSFMDSLRMLKEALPDMFGHMPDPSRDSWERWVAVVVKPECSWASVVKQFTKSFLSSNETVDRVTVAPIREDCDQNRDDMQEHESKTPVKRRRGRPKKEKIVPEEDRPNSDGQFTCVECGRSFATLRGRSSHMRCAHGIVPAHALLVRDRSCPTCGSTLKSRSEAVNHIKGTRACLSWALTHVEPMSIVEYKRATAREKVTSRHLARDEVPAQGPKLVGEDSRPQTRTVQPMNIYEDRDGGEPFLDGDP
eukprot:6460765-Amphidinium_carterae.2